MQNNLEKKALILFLIEKMGEKGSWCGETHVQKCLYFLQELMKVPLNYNYILYKHGPFSFDLRSELTEMRAHHYLELLPREPYGPSIVPGRFAFLLEKKYSEAISQYSEQVEFIADYLASKPVRELEQLATALYVKTRKKIESEDELVKEIVELKPHISPDSAYTALKFIEQLERSLLTGNV